MKLFSIKDLEVLSGVKAHTIRAWEKRYTVFQPVRSEGNIRRYSVDELSKLLGLSLLTESKLRISRLASMSDEEMFQNLRLLKGDSARTGQFIHGLTVAMYKMDIDAFEALLDESFLEFPPEKVVQEILYPFLSKVNLLCQGKRQNEEHLVVTCIRRKLLWCIENSTAPASPNKSILLFLSGEKGLDLLLLYFYYHLKLNGWKVIYMGMDVSLPNIEDMLLAKKPHYLLTYLPTKNPLQLNVLAEKVKHLTDNTTVLLVHPEGINRTKKTYDNIRNLSCTEALQWIRQIA